jgi:hypothetical protein
MLAQRQSHRVVVFVTGWMSGPRSPLLASGWRASSSHWGPLVHDSHWHTPPTHFPAKLHPRSSVQTLAAAPTDALDAHRTTKATAMMMICSRIPTDGLSMDAVSQWHKSHNQLVRSTSLQWLRVMLVSKGTCGHEAASTRGAQRGYRGSKGVRREA